MVEVVSDMDDPPNVKETESKVEMCPVYMLGLPGGVVFFLLFAEHLTAKQRSTPGEMHDKGECRSYHKENERFNVREPELLQRDQQGSQAQGQEIEDRSSGSSTVAAYEDEQPAPNQTHSQAAKGRHQHAPTRGKSLVKQNSIEKKMMQVC